TSTFAADGRSFALTLGVPASSNIAINTGVATLAIQMFFVVIVFPFLILFLQIFVGSDGDLGPSTHGLSRSPAGWIQSMKPMSLGPRVASRRSRDCCH